MDSPVQHLIGRKRELELIQACIDLDKNVLLEGPVGVGKTHLAQVAAVSQFRPIFRVDGDGRFSEQKLTGWFDPPTVVEKGFVEASFFAGPLIEAMKAGGILFINELNRLPEGVQNVLLPAIDEKLIIIPKLGEIKAKKGFLVIATQNPKEFVATSHLSEAVLDRFELVTLNYQSKKDEVDIVTNKVKTKISPNIILASVLLARLTRSHEKINRGASVRAALSLAELNGKLQPNQNDFATFLEAVKLSLPTRVEFSLEMTNSKPLVVLEELAKKAYDEAFQNFKKKT
jgi:MoxR-like ATPase